MPYTRLTMTESREVEEFRMALREAAAAVRAADREVAETVREDLLRQRADIDAQLAILEKTLEQQPSNGAVPRSTQQSFRFPATPRAPSKRLVLLRIMAEAPEQGWTTRDLRQRLQEAGSLPTDKGKAGKQFHTLLYDVKNKGEIANVGETGSGVYRLTDAGKASVSP
jgi:hypothetical protein